MSNEAIGSTSQDKADGYDAVIEVFSHLYKELKTLGNKKPAETLSENKVKIVNRILQDIKKIMKEEPENKYLDILDSELLPQYSDAILILSQYEGALKSFKQRYYGWDSFEGKNMWNLTS